MQKFLLILSMLLITALSGCFGGDRVFLAKNHGIDIEKIALDVRGNYKIGSSERILIRDFASKGYRYIPPKTDQKGRLIYPSLCGAPRRSNMHGEQVYIAWISDEQGLISRIEEPKITSCGVIYP